MVAESHSRNVGGLQLRSIGDEIVRKQLAVLSDYDVLLGGTTPQNPRFAEEDALLGGKHATSGGFSQLASLSSG
jgi:hypothetical protein